MQKTFIPALALALAGALGLAGQTTTPTKPTPPTPAQMASNQVTHLTTLLTLTSDQQTQALAIFTTEYTTLAALRDSMTAPQTALTTAVEADDTAGIATAATQIGTLTAQRVQAQGTADAAFYVLLTADQQTKYKELLSSGGDMGGGGGPGRGPGHGHGGPPPAN